MSAIRPGTGSTDNSLEIKAHSILEEKIIQIPLYKIIRNPDSLRPEEQENLEKLIKWAVEFEKSVIDKNQLEAKEALYLGVACIARKLAGAKDYFHIAANKGTSNGWLYLGICYKEGIGVPKNEKEAVACYRKAAELGDAVAWRCLGICYGTGIGVTKNEEEAVACYRKAAKLGDAVAWSYLGVCYGTGIGVTKNEKKAVDCSGKAAELGRPEGWYNLGACYEGGIGVPKNGKKAVACYRKAADGGLAQGWVSLGVCYEYGIGVPKNEKEAVACFRKAAELGEAAGWYNLGICYKNGRGVLKNTEEAESCYFRSFCLEGEKKILKLYAAYPFTLPYYQYMREENPRKVPGDFWKDPQLTLRFWLQDIQCPLSVVQERCYEKMGKYIKNNASSFSIFRIKGPEITKIQLELYKHFQDKQYWEMIDRSELMKLSNKDQYDVGIIYYNFSQEHKIDSPEYLDLRKKAFDHLIISAKHGNQDASHFLFRSAKDYLIDYYDVNQFKENGLQEYSSFKKTCVDFWMTSIKQGNPDAICLLFSMATDSVITSKQLASQETFQSYLKNNKLEDKFNILKMLLKEDWGLDLINLLPTTKEIKTEIEIKSSSANRNNLGFFPVLLQSNHASDTLSALFNIRAQIPGILEELGLCSPDHAELSKLLKRQIEPIISRLADTLIIPLDEDEQDALKRIRLSIEDAKKDLSNVIKKDERFKIWPTVNPQKWPQPLKELLAKIDEMSSLLSEAEQEKKKESIPYKGFRPS